VATISLRSVFHFQVILPCHLFQDGQWFICARSLILKPWLPNFIVLPVIIADWFYPLTGPTCCSTHYSLLTEVNIDSSPHWFSNLIDALLISTLIKFFLSLPPHPGSV
jgi:hypothetical protein